MANNIDPKDLLRAWQQRAVEAQAQAQRNANAFYEAMAAQQRRPGDYIGYLGLAQQPQGYGYMTGGYGGLAQAFGQGYGGLAQAFGQGNAVSVPAGDEAVSYDVATDRYCVRGNWFTAAQIEDMPEKARKLILGAVKPEKEKEPDPLVARFLGLIKDLD